MCSITERLSRRFFSNLHIAGLITVLAVIVSTAMSIYLILAVAASFSLMLESIVAIFLLYTTIAARDLLRHSNEVFTALQSQNPLERGRKAVAKIVGRDTSSLNDEEICRACIETVAENMVDGITAPLFYAILGSLLAPVFNISPIGCSAIGAFIYKAVNTMDSMIGYKNDKYQQFGMVAAKLDDVINFVPARISGFCLIIAAFFLKLDYRKAASVFFRDRLEHSSPNAGHTEAATAGALGLRLGGPSSYFDKVVEKPYMGDGERHPVPEDIQSTNRLVIIGSLIFFIFMVGLRYLII